MRKNTILKLLTVLVLSVIVIACGDQGESGDAEGDDVQTLRIAAVHPEDHPQTQAVYEYAERVTEDTDGALEFNVYPANQLGDYETVYNEISEGTIDMALITLPGERNSNLEILSFPYLVDSYEQADILFSADDGYVFEIVDEMVKEEGIQLLGLRAMGFGGVGATKEIENAAEPGADKNIIARIPQMNTWREYATQIGFNTNSLPFSEIFSSLQTGVVDATLGSPASSNYDNFRDVITDYYQYQNSLESTGLIINQELFDSFSEDVQNILTERGKEFTAEGIEMAEEIDNDYMQKLEEEGITVHRFTDEEISAMAEFTRENVWPEIDVVDQEYLDNVIEALNSQD